MPPPPTAGQAKPPVFLDRDGTLIVEKHYLSDPNGVELESGVTDGLALLQAAGCPLIVVSNQSGIGRGLVTEAQVTRINERLAQLLVTHGIHIDAWYLCPHAPHEECGCRKPRPGMAHAAARDLAIELRGSYVIGDKRSDVEFADAIAATGLLLHGGHGRDALDWAREHSRLSFETFADAAAHIERRVRAASTGTMA